jgi:type II secretory pathway component PulM
MIKKILAWLAAIGAFITSILSAIFYVLFKQAKIERMEQEDRAMKAEFDAAIAQKNADLKKEDQELAQKNHSGNQLDNFNAGLDRLRKSSQRGKERAGDNGKS